ncbi:MAG: hypothetical protein P4N60_11175 [Verrucomicrobiae bacterium]|nr:hypothetical protein [Verrucomicrobiae bacterium]
MKRIQKLNQNPERPFGSLIKKSADKAPDVTTAALLIKIGAKLKVPFTAGDLVAKSGCDMKKAQNTLTRWKVKKWVESVSRGAYEHTKTFGQEKGDLVETAATVREEEPKALPPAPVNGKTAAAGSSYDLPEGSLERKVYHQAMKLPDPFTAAALGVALGFSADAAALTLAKLEKKAMVKNVGVEDGDVLYSIA